MNIKYCGPALDYSGYGEANRHDIAALVSAGVEVSVELTRHSLEISEFGRLGQLVQSRANIPLKYDIKILHTTPNIYNRFIEPGKYHIGRIIWETSKLPPDFVEGAKMMDEIWTASKYTAQAIKNSGINKPVYIIPEAIDTDIPLIQPLEFEGKSGYYFYSVFEFTERKNPSTLLRAFWEEFESTEGVSLVIKTHIDNFTPDKRRELRSAIATIKNRIKLKRYAPVYIFNTLMTRKQVYRFHQTFDCFVSPHRGEGWGVPQMEAMLLGKPIISTDCGGIHESLTNNEDAFLIPYKLIPLVANSRNQQWYLPDQMWADVDMVELKKAMRFVFENKLRGKEVGTNGKIKVLQKFSLGEVGRIMRERLENIPLDNHKTIT
jgi:glycosyltransferase involved in cell wall biosynthesis